MKQNCSEWRVQYCKKTGGWEVYRIRDIVNMKRHGNLTVWDSFTDINEALRYAETFNLMAERGL